MIEYRLRGLLNLHIGASTAAVLLLAVVYRHVLEWIQPAESYRIGVDLTPYLLCIGIGMILSARFLKSYSTRLHWLTWVDVARLTSSQVTVLSLLLFAFMFAFKDRGMSRLFLGSFLVLSWFMLFFINYSLPSFLSKVLFNQPQMMRVLFIGSPKNLARMEPRRLSATRP